MLSQLGRLLTLKSSSSIAFCSKRTFSSALSQCFTSTQKHSAMCRCNSCSRNGIHGFKCSCSRCYSNTPNNTNANESSNTKANTNTNTSDTTTTTTSTDSTSVVDERDTKLAQLQDSYLRCLADMENLRNRTKKEVESASSYAIQKFCKDLVSVADVLELALGSVKDDPRTAQLLKGQEEIVEEGDTPSDASETVLQLSKEELGHRLKDLSVGLSMTLSEMVKVFARHGVTAIDPLHQKFDPNVHMAMYEVPNSDLDPGTVIAVQKKGYLLNHRVIRPASVGVSKKQ